MTRKQKKEAKTQGFRLPGWDGVLLASFKRSKASPRKANLQPLAGCIALPFFRDAPLRLAFPAF
jgi:hypothetical protein